MLGEINCFVEIGSLAGAKIDPTHRGLGLLLVHSGPKRFIPLVLKPLWQSAVILFARTCPAVVKVRFASRAWLGLVGDPHFAFPATRKGFRNSLRGSRNYCANSAFFVQKTNYCAKPFRPQTLNTPFRMEVG